MYIYLLLFATHEWCRSSTLFHKRDHFGFGLFDLLFVFVCQPSTGVNCCLEVTFRVEGMSEPAAFNGVKASPYCRAKRRNRVFSCAPFRSMKSSNETNPPPTLTTKTLFFNFVIDEMRKRKVEKRLT